MVRVGLLKVFGGNDDNRRLLDSDDATASISNLDYEPPKGLQQDYGEVAPETIQEEPQQEAFPEPPQDNSPKRPARSLSSAAATSPIKSKHENNKSMLKKSFSDRRLGRKNSKRNMMAEYDQDNEPTSPPKSPSSKSKPSSSKGSKETTTDPAMDSLVTTASEHGSNEFLQFSFDNNFFKGDNGNNGGSLLSPKKDGGSNHDENEDDEIPLSSVSNRVNSRNSSKDNSKDGGAEPTPAPTRRARRRHSSARLSLDAFAQVGKALESKQQQAEEPESTKGRRARRRRSVGNLVEVMGREGMKENALLSDDPPPPPANTTLDRQSSNDSTPKTRRKRQTSSASARHGSSSDGGDETGDEGCEKTSSSSKRRSKKSSSKRDKNSHTTPDSPESAVSKKSTDDETPKNGASESQPSRGLLKAPSLTEVLTEEESEGEAENEKEKEVAASKTSGRRGGRRSGRESTSSGDDEREHVGGRLQRSLSTDQIHPEGVEETPRRKAQRAKSVDHMDIVTFLPDLSGGDGETPSSPTTSSKKKKQRETSDLLSPAASTASKRKLRGLKRNESAKHDKIHLDLNADSTANEQDASAVKDPPSSAGELLSMDNGDAEEEQRNPRQAPARRRAPRRSSTGELSSMASVKGNPVASTGVDFFDELAKKRSSSSKTGDEPNDQPPETPKKEKGGQRKTNRRRRRSMSDCSGMYFPKNVPKKESKEPESPGYRSDSADAPRSKSKNKMKSLLPDDNDNDHSDDNSLVLDDAAGSKKSKSKKGDLNSSAAVIESSMKMLEENVAEMKEVPFVSLHLSKGEEQEENTAPPPTSTTGRGSPVNDIAQIDGTQLGNLELISKLREELVESNMLLNESRLEAVRLKEEVDELKAKLQELLNK